MTKCGAAGVARARISRACWSNPSKAVDGTDLTIVPRYVMTKSVAKVIRRATTRKAMIREVSGADTCTEEATSAGLQYRFRAIYMSGYR